MALLHRFLRLNDSNESGIFTFIVTRSVTRDLHRDVISKEFSYGYHRWSISFARSDRYLSIYLVWRNPSEGMKVQLDFSITLMNRDHFSENRNFAMKNAKFTKDTPYQGGRKFVQMSVLEANGFMDRNGEFQLEFTLSNIKSIYEHKFKMNQSIFTGSRMSKLETSYFSFGIFDWSLSVYPSGRSESQLGTSESESCHSTGGLSPTMSVYLNRHTGLDRTCRVKFNIILGGGNGASALDDQRNSHESVKPGGESSGQKTESGLRDEFSDIDGRSMGWLPRVKLADCISRGVFKMVVEMISVNSVSQIDLPVVPPNPIGMPLYDKDKLAWEIEPDTHGETLRLRMIHKDASNIPRNHIRYVSWTAYLIKKHPKLASALGADDSSSSSFLKEYTAKLPLDQKVYFQYYVQDDTEDGILMDTKIPIKEISDPGNGYLIGRSNIRLHIEWLHSCLLFQSTYSKYDDITRVQTYQMRQDIQNMRLETEVLEQQLLSYEREHSLEADSGESRCLFLHQDSNEEPL